MGGWGLVAAILGAFLLIAAAVREGRALVGWVRRRFFPEPPPPPIPPPVRISDQIAADLSYTQDPGSLHRRLARIAPRYTIHNGGGDYAIRDATTGVRRRGGTVAHRFDWPRLGARGESATCLAGPDGLRRTYKERRR